MATASGGTAQRILEGALAAMARRGRRKLSMSDVLEYSGVSRGTLYRYFKNKEELLEAIALYVKQGSLEVLRETVAERPEPEHRLEVVLGAMIQYRTLHPEARRVLELEPEFGLEWVRGLVPEWTEIISEMLEPAVPYIPAVRDGSVGLRELAHLVLRVALSSYLIPTPEIDSIPRWLELLVARAQDE